MSVKGATVGFCAWVKHTKLSRDDYLLCSNEDGIVVFCCLPLSTFVNHLLPTQILLKWCGQTTTTVAHFLEARCIN